MFTYKIEWYTTVQKNKSIETVQRLQYLLFVRGAFQSKSEITKYAHKKTYTHLLINYDNISRNKSHNV